MEAMEGSSRDRQGKRRRKRNKKAARRRGEEYRLQDETEKEGNARTEPKKGEEKGQVKPRVKETTILEKYDGERRVVKVRLAWAEADEGPGKMLLLILNLKHRGDCEPEEVEQSADEKRSWRGTRNALCSLRPLFLGTISQ